MTICIPFKTSLQGKKGSSKNTSRTKDTEQNGGKKKRTLRAGFEPAREYPIGFQVQRLNHSAIAAGYMPTKTSKIKAQNICHWDHPIDISFNILFFQLTYGSACVCWKASIVFLPLLLSAKLLITGLSQ